MFKSVNGVNVPLTEQEIADRQAEEGQAAADATVQARGSASLSRDAFSIMAASAGWVTEAEAEDWAAGIAIPAVATQAISLLPVEKQFAARVYVRSQLVVHRNDNLILAMQAILQLTDEAVDTVFGL
jgi:hypothetical protein